MNEICWLPELEYLAQYENIWSIYESALYSIFKSDFIDSYPLYKNTRVNVKHYPIEYGKEEAFFHTTCKDYTGNGARVPDFRRCERIRWVRAFIENYDCDLSKCEDCDGVKVWNEPYKSKTRVHLLLEEERYMVVLEERKGYFLLIPAFYLDYGHALQKQLKHYKQYRSIQPSSSGQYFFSNPIDQSKEMDII